MSTIASMNVALTATGDQFSAVLISSQALVENFARKADEAANKARGSFGRFTDKARGGIEALGQSAVKAAGVAAVITLVSQSADMAAKSVSKLSRDIVDGEKSAEEIGQSFLDSLPVIGSATKATKSVFNATLDAGAATLRMVGYSEQVADQWMSNASLAEKVAEQSKKTEAAWARMEQARGLIRGQEDELALMQATTDEQRRQIANEQQLRDEKEKIAKTNLTAGEKGIAARYAEQKAAEREAAAKAEAQKTVDETIRSQQEQLAVLNAQSDADADRIGRTQQLERELERIAKLEASTSEKDALIGGAKAIAQLEEAKARQAAAEQSQQATRSLQDQLDLLNAQTTADRERVKLAQQLRDELEKIAKSNASPEDKAKQSDLAKQSADQQGAAIAKTAEEQARDAKRAQEDELALLQAKTDKDRERIQLAQELRDELERIAKSEMSETQKAEQSGLARRIADEKVAAGRRAEADALVESLQTPTQQYTAKLREIDELLASKSISAETAAKAASTAQQEFGFGPQKEILAGVAERGSLAAFQNSRRDVSGKKIDELQLKALEDVAKTLKEKLGQQTAGITFQVVGAEALN